MTARASIAACALGLSLMGSPASAQVPPSPTAHKEDSMSRSATKERRPQDADTSAIRPFHVEFPQSALDDLRTRIKATRWPEEETDPTQGVQLATAQALARYWATDYDWRKCEAKLNALPQFITEIDGLDIHFIHVRSKEPNALPLIISHGWPGSILEMTKIIGPLTDPVAHGGKAEDAFDVVIPSMPGYGFSGKPTAAGWGPEHIARAWAVLMKRLGYDRYVAQGGDWGAMMVELMAVQAPPGLLAIHTNMPFAVPPEISKAIQDGAPPAGLSAEEKRAYDRLDFFFKKGLGYALEMGNRPQTLYGIADSPVGLAAWILDHDLLSYELIARVFDGKTEGLTRDDVLDNITLYWLTNTGVSSARLYWENKLPFFGPMHVAIPVAVSAFRDELYQAPRSWVERAYPNLLDYRTHDKGCHFAAWEQPEALVSDLRESLRTLRCSDPRDDPETGRRAVGARRPVAFSTDPRVCENGPARCRRLRRAPRGNAASIPVRSGGPRWTTRRSSSWSRACSTRAALPRRPAATRPSCSRRSARSCGGSARSTGTCSSSSRRRSPPWTTRAPSGRRRTSRTCPATWCSPCSGTAGWASSTRPGTCGSTAPWRSRCCSRDLTPAARA